MGLSIATLLAVPPIYMTPLFRFFISFKKVFFEMNEEPKVPPPYIGRGGGGKAVADSRTPGSPFGPAVSGSRSVLCAFRRVLWPPTNCEGLRVIGTARTNPVAS
jgi:hypothetical protein